MSVYERLLEHCQSLRIIDTHEHLAPESDWAKSEADFLAEYLLQYFSIDIVSAGLPQETFYQKVINPRCGLPLMERWALVEPFWEAARNTGYGRSLDIAVQRLYGVERIQRSTIEQLNEQLAAARRATASGARSHYTYALKEKAGIEVSILDWGIECDRTFFRPVYRLDRFIRPPSPADIRNSSGYHWCNINDTDIRSLGDLMAASEADLEWAMGKGICGLKCGLAYERSLYFPETPREEAARSFEAFMAWDGTGPRTDTAPLENFMMHHCLSLAHARGLTYQFHTGLQEGHGNKLGNSDPELMCTVFMKYPAVTFDVFHIGYPYQHKLCALAKMFPNVIIDMAWAHVISPEACVRGLVEWLDAVPANKICGFGGDYLFPDGVVGHAAVARDNIARALAEKVEKGVFGVDRAREVANLLLIDTPARIFHLGAK